MTRGRGVPAGRPRARRGTVALGLLLVVGAPAAAQQPTAPIAVAEQATPSIDISPRGAFLRALAFPGWGHAAIGAHTRGAFYFGAETAVAYTLVRSRLRLKEAERRLARREAFVRERAADAGVVDPSEIESVVDADTGVTELRSLRDARGDQQEDMVALGIFLLFLSGADAYVSAHLSRFPAPLGIEGESSADGRVELSLTLALPR